MITVLYGDVQANDYTVPEKKTNQISAKKSEKIRWIKIQLKIRKEKKMNQMQLKIRKEKKINQNSAQKQ